MEMNFDSLQEMYEFVQEKYDEYAEGKIEEDEYLQYLEEYKRRLAENDSGEDVVSQVNEENDNNPETPKRVRSTSIAGLRKKLMEEMEK